MISYASFDVRGKSFAFTLGGREDADLDPPRLDPEKIRRATTTCAVTVPATKNSRLVKLFDSRPPRFPNGPAAGMFNSPWVMRVFNKRLFPRIPAELTGNRNESYIVVEDPRHFVETPRTQTDLIFTRRARRGTFPFI